MAQTKILFNREHLLELLHQHFVSEGLLETASTLVKEANLNHASSVNMPKLYAKYSSLTPNRVSKYFDTVFKLLGP